MFYKEHEPPHFHAEYQGQQAEFDFEGEIVAGYIRSRTARSLIQQWARAHRVELDKNWKKMKAGSPLNQIAPLE